jgi:DNA-binding HxlR family transcriptional regulator
MIITVVSRRTMYPVIPPRVEYALTPLGAPRSSMPRVRW